MKAGAGHSPPPAAAPIASWSTRIFFAISFFRSLIALITRSKVSTQSRKWTCTCSERNAG